MPETVTQCPLCDSDRSSLFDQRTFRGQTVANRLCKNCGLVYQSPRMTSEEADTFYAAEYRRIYQGSEGPSDKDLAVQRARAAALLAFARRHVKLVTCHLDIGCSAGLLLQKIAEGYHCQPVGVEPGEAYRAHARGQGLTIYASLEELEKKEKALFDLVSLAHVLEHLPDPASYLTRLRETLLAPGGWLLLEVPNLYAHDSFETAHLLSFSARTLARTVKKAGFDIVRMEAHGRPRSGFIPYYLTLLARPMSDTNQIPRLYPEKLVALKRRFGLLSRRILSRLFPNKTWIELS
jgi:SAM-dependent methyltransferase